MSKVGIIGGSGLYEIEGIENLREEKVETPFGDPSDSYITGVLDGVEVVFLPRHGKRHSITPSEINFRANIFGMKKLGVTKIISVSAVGSMKAEYKPGDIVIPDQFFDRTRGRTSTFFGNGIVGHVSFADPVCPDLSDLLYKAGTQQQCDIHQGGTYICIEGPMFSSRAESKIYRKWGVDIIGMTNITEAKLAREAEICYSTMALVTDYDVWHDVEEDVTADAVLAIIAKNVAVAKNIIKTVISKIPAERKCVCSTALKNAIVTDPAVIPKKTKSDLEPIFGKHLV